MKAIIVPVTEPQPASLTVESQQNVNVASVAVDTALAFSWINPMCQRLMAHSQE